MGLGLKCIIQTATLQVVRSCQVICISLIEVMADSPYRVGVMDEKREGISVSSFHTQGRSSMTPYMPILRH
ncbi:hypothetical protein ABEB36_004392 [Hypothenemus hampei]|uniref:Uncharacterized protein n=1 Tax=Hypothenemus hampei TaxID=57062 RepID=A0ABD1F6Y2_HYPHA